MIKVDLNAIEWNYTSTAKLTGSTIEMDLQNIESSVYTFSILKYDPLIEYDLIRATNSTLKKQPVLTWNRMEQSAFTTLIRVWSSYCSQAPTKLCTQIYNVGLK